MIRRPTHFGWALLAGAILLISILVFHRYLPYVGNRLGPEEPPAVMLEMHNAYFVGLNHKEKIWSLKAKRVEIGQNRYLTTLTGITKGKIFNAGSPTLEMKAGRAVYNSIAGDLVLDQGVSFQGDNGQHVRTSGAIWNSATSSLRSNGMVEYEGPWGKASTDRMLVDMKSKEMTMWNVVISVEPSKMEGG